MPSLRLRPAATGRGRMPVKAALREGSQRAGRRPAMTFPFHCMWTGTKSEATQGNTLRCRVSLNVGDAAMIAALRPKSPCGKAQDECWTMLCQIAGRASIAEQGEPVPEALRPRT